MVHCILFLLLISSYQETLFSFRLHVFPGLLPVFVELCKKIQPHIACNLYLSLIKVVSASVVLFSNTKEIDHAQYFLAAEAANKHISGVCAVILQSWKFRGDWSKCKTEDITQELRVCISDNLWSHFRFMLI